MTREQALAAAREIWEEWGGSVRLAGSMQKAIADLVLRAVEEDRLGRPALPGAPMSPAEQRGVSRTLAGCTQGAFWNGRPEGAALLVWANGGEQGTGDPVTPTDDDLTLLVYAHDWLAAQQAQLDHVQAVLHDMQQDADAYWRGFDDGVEKCAAEGEDDPWGPYLRRRLKGWRGGSVDD